MKSMITNTRARSMLLLLTCLSVSNVLLGSTITLYTPNGHSVQAITRQEYGFNDLELLEIEQQLQQHPNVIVISEKSHTYNCHSYAWNMTEGGPTCWLNSYPDLHWYWDDGSYVETTEPYAEKVHYYLGDHSAVAIHDNLGRYVSKWGSGPLVKHAPNDVPTSYMGAYRHYYAKAPKSISGALTIGGTEELTFSINCIPVNTNLSWGYNENLLTKISESGNSITLKAKTPTTTGDATLIAYLTKTDGTTYKTIFKYIGVGGPHWKYVRDNFEIRRSSDWLKVFPNGIGLRPNTFYYGILQSIGVHHVNWGMNYVEINTSTDDRVYFKTLDSGYATLHMTGTTSYGLTKVLLDCSILPEASGASSPIITPPLEVMEDSTQTAI